MKPHHLISAGAMIFVLGLAGCASSGGNGKTVELCDSAGCRTVNANDPGRTFSPETPPAPRINENAYLGENLETLRAQLAAGDAIAGYKLGNVYRDGLGGAAPDLQLAANFFKQSSDLGDPGASRALGMLLLARTPGQTGTPSPQQYAQAIELLTIAAEAGDPVGMLELGRELFTGDFMQRDPVAAAQLFQLAADNDLPEAKYYLGQMHFRGIGRNQNGYQAIKLTQEAAVAGNVLAQRSLGQVYINGYETVGPDFAAAQRWLTAAAQNGDPEAAKLLELLQSGEYVPGGGAFTTLMSAGDIVKASEAAMRGITAARRRLEQGGTLTDPVVIDWGDTPRTSPRLPGRQPGGQTTVTPASTGGNCFIIEHSARVEGRVQERTEQVCENDEGRYGVSI